LVKPITNIVLLSVATSIYFIRKNIPETKGLTLEEIEQQFHLLSKGPESPESNPLLPRGAVAEVDMP
jgi:hypothetical protein